MNYIFTHYSGNMDLVNSGLVMFFNSILKNVNNCKIKFFTSNSYEDIPTNIKNIINDNSDVIELIKVVNVKLGIIINNQRYFHYLDYINKNNHLFSDSDKFIHCDNTDLVFIDNVFDKLENNDKIHVFQEDKKFTLGDLTVNKEWVVSLGDNTLIDRIGHNIVLCAGTIISESLKSFLSICNDICFGLMRFYNHAGMQMNDQGVFNSIVYDDMYRIFYKNKFQFHTNEEPDMVFTMACVDGDTYKMIDNKMFCHNKFPSIIHQYNRKEDATKWLKNIFM